MLALRQSIRRARRQLPPTTTSHRCSTQLRPIISTTLPTHKQQQAQERPPLPQSYQNDTLLSSSKILIANRGEIAIRIARAAKALGAQSVAICAPEDVTSPHVSVADEFVVLEKGATAIAPYLDIEELTKVAVECGVDFVHPGELVVYFVCIALHCITLCVLYCIALSNIDIVLNLLAICKNYELKLAFIVQCTIHSFIIHTFIYTSRITTGYGFLSESAPFAQSLVNSNITWVGPPPDVLHLFGDKIQARALAQSNNVPIVRGSDNLSSGEECLSILEGGSGDAVHVRLPAIMKVCAYISHGYASEEHVLVFISLMHLFLYTNLDHLNVLGCIWWRGAWHA